MKPKAVQERNFFYSKKKNVKKRSYVQRSKREISFEKEILLVFSNTSAVILHKPVTQTCKLGHRKTHCGRFSFTQMSRLFCSPSQYIVIHVCFR